MKFYSVGSGQINVIFLHGWGAGKDSFVWMKDYLEDMRLHFASLDGFDGTPPPKDATIAGYTAQLKQYIYDKKLKNIVLVGHSFGGRIAIEYCSKNDILRLILVDSAGIKPKFSFKKAVAVLKYKMTKKLVKMKLAKSSMLTKFGSSDYKSASAEMKKVFLSAISYDQTKLLAKINTPTLIVWGKHDAETPMYMAKKLNKKIKNSELVTLDGGHFSFLDEPYKFYRIVSYFIKTKVGEKYEYDL